MELKDKDRRRLVRELREVAKRHYNGTLKNWPGLCAATYNLPRHPHNNIDCYYVLIDLGLIGRDNEFLCLPGWHWDERAMFALVLAEYLEQGGEV